MSDYVQEAKAMPCEMVEADFSGNTVTVRMLNSEFRVQAGLHYLIPAAHIERGRVPSGLQIVELGFRFSGDYQHHIPRLAIEFEPVPVGEPNDAKGWKDRDAVAAMLAAAPAAPDQSAAPAPTEVPMPEPRAWLRRWAFDGETPRKERNEQGRMAWLTEFKMLPVTQHKVFRDDVPLYANGDAREAAGYARGLEAAKKGGE